MTQCHEAVRSAVGEKERRRQRATLMGFMKRFRKTVPELAALDLSLDVDTLQTLIRDFLQQYMTPGFKAYLDAARLSEFRRTKELVHEASAQLDQEAGDALAIARCRGAIQEFPHIFSDAAQAANDVELITYVAKSAVAWLTDRGMYGNVEEFLGNTEVSAQLRFKRLLLEIRRVLQEKEVSTDGETVSTASTSARTTMTTTTVSEGDSEEPRRETAWRVNIAPETTRSWSVDLRPWVHNELIAHHQQWAAAPAYVGWY
mmetsp:Transcript_11312/g.25082  ORF Transcript_11312/g.25082 Transcript_11312/m.25082 type:complete len:259 (-) Transcript_11312:129-905(-)